MTLADFGFWWLVSVLGSFAALYGLSRAFASRWPRGFRLLWLVFFVKLLVPWGSWSPLPTVSETVVPTTLTSVVPVERGEAGREESAPSVARTSVRRSTLSVETVLGLLWVGGTAILGLLVVVQTRSRSRPASGPAVVGFLRPRIVVPEDFATRFTPLERELILAHETRHLRAGDPFWIALVQTLVCLFWWVPVVWWARKEFLAVLELACDEVVLSSRPAAESRVYGQLLVRLAHSGRRDAGAAFAGTFAGLKRRLVATVGPRRSRAPWTLVFTLVAATGLGALSLTPRANAWSWPLPSATAVPEALSPAEGQVTSAPLRIGVAPGTPVTAAAAGKVAGVRRASGGGTEVVVNHADHTSLIYGGLDPAPGMVVGTEVSRNQVLGTIHGEATYAPADTVLPHLDLTVTREGLTVDPATLFVEPTLLEAPHFLDQPLAWPLGGQKGFPTSRFGMEVHPFTGKPYFHEGVDQAVRLGTPVLAVAAGTVTEVGNEPLSKGWYVVVDHGNGRTSLYSHLRSEPPVGTGQSVATGAVLGAAGASGLATGPHLHWELRVNGRLVDPSRVVYQRP